MPYWGTWCSWRRHQQDETWVIEVLPISKQVDVINLDCDPCRWLSFPQVTFFTFISTDWCSLILSNCFNALLVIIIVLVVLLFISFYRLIHLQIFVMCYWLNYFSLASNPDSCQSDMELFFSIFFHQLWTSVIVVRIC